MGSSFQHDDEQFSRHRHPSGADIAVGEAKYAELVREIIWHGVITPESRQRLNTALDVYGVARARARQIEEALVAAHQAQHSVPIIEEEESVEDEVTLDADTVVGDRVTLAPLAAAEDPSLLTLQRRIEVLEHQCDTLGAERQRHLDQIDGLERLVEQLQGALESTLDELDTVSRRLDEKVREEEQRKTLEPPPSSSAAHDEAEAPDPTDGFRPAPPENDVPAPSASLTQAAGAHGRFDEEARCDGEAQLAEEGLDDEAWVAEEHTRDGEDSDRARWAKDVATLRARRNDPDEIHARFRADPRNGEALHELFEALERGADQDRRWCVAHALTYRGEATDAERAFHDAHASDRLVRPRRAVNDDEWRELLCHPDEDPLIGEVLAAIAPSVLLGHLTAVRASIAPEAIDPSRRIEPEHARVQAARAIAWGADILGIKPPATYLCPDHPGSIDMVLNPEPVTRLGARALGERSHRELAFVAGQHLTWYRSEHLLGQPSRSVRRLEDTFLAALTIGNPGLPLTEDVKQRVEPIARTIRPLLDDEAVRKLQDAFSAFVAGGGRTNLSRWYRSVEHTADCAGLLLCNDLAVAEAALRAEQPDRAEMAMDELVVFSTGARCSLLRKRIGIALDPLAG